MKLRNGKKVNPKTKTKRTLFFRDHEICMKILYQGKYEHFRSKFLEMETRILRLENENLCLKDTIDICNHMINKTNRKVLQNLV